MSGSRLHFALFAAWILSSWLAGAGEIPSKNPSPSASPEFRLAFGSCLKQYRPQPIWDAVIDSRPDAFVFMGDNVYADTRDPDVMRAAYATLAAQPGFRRLRRQCPVLATWDDHDFGENDAGRDYPMKDASKAIFLEFFEVAEDSPRRSRSGIYERHVFDSEVGRVQLILLDTRTFRGPLQRQATIPGDSGPYVPASDPTIPLLGDAQWSWLERVLEEPADWRVIVSSIQVIPEGHPWEKWANLPEERRRLLTLLRRRGMEGVVLLSGDRHHGEFSRYDEGTDFPLYEVTASGMNCARKRPRSETNRHRLGDLVLQDHFGLLRIRGRGASAVLDLQLRGIDGRVLAHRTVRRSD